MARTIHNSKACSCCGRLMPVAKRGKRKSCSPQCAVAIAYSRRKDGPQRNPARNSVRTTGQMATTKEATP